jgi:hypothetical protein
MLHVLADKSRNNSPITGLDREYMDMRQNSTTSIERRSEIRVNGVFPTYLRGVSAIGESFKAHTLIDNISEGGVYLQLPYSQLAGDIVFTVARLPSGVSIASFGQILRVEAKPNRLYGMAVAFKRPRILARPA